MMKFYFNEETRQFTWQDKATGVIYEGNEGDKSRPMKVLGDFTALDKSGKEKALPKNYKGGTGTNRREKTIKVGDQAKELAGKDMIGRKAYQKMVKAEKAAYMNSDKYKTTKSNLQNVRARIKDAKSSGLKKGLAYGVAGATAAGVGAYAINKAIQKKKEREAEEARR